MQIRAMTAEDATEVAEVRVGGWRFAYEGIMPAGYLASMSVTEDARRHRARLAAATGRRRDLVAVDPGGRIRGWVALGSYRDGEGARAPEGAGEVYALYVRPGLVGTGTGRALMDAARVQAVGLSYTRLLLWVVRDNTRARRFYERAGFAPDGAEESYETGGVPVPELRYAADLSK